MDLDADDNEQGQDQLDVVAVDNKQVVAVAA